MATTRIIPMHQNKGKTIRQCLSYRLDYGKNPDKTQEGQLISAYACDPETADAEFALSKREYFQLTGRRQDSDVIAYQVRQSFRPGEITPEEANRIGYEFAERFLKGNHAFIVCTHTDKQHIHNHIYWNSTSLDCTRKFRDFIGSARAVRRLSDLICLENGLSYIAHPKLHSKGKFKHYGEWRGDNRPPTFQERLKAQIDACLAEKPPDMDAFLQAMAKAGYVVKRGRGGTISFRAEGQERFTRLRSSTLGKGYGPEDIQAVIEGRAAPSGGPAESTRKVNLIIDIQSRMKNGKGPAYERWMKIFNLKQMAATLQYLQENGLLEYGQLEKRAMKAADHFHVLSEQIKSIEGAMSANAELKGAVVDYAKTRPVFNGYKAAKYSKKYLAEHDAEIALYRAAQETFRRVLSGAKLPKTDALKAEYQMLAAEKRAAYREYRAVRKDMQEVVTAKENIDHLFSLTDAQKNKEQER